MKEDGKPRVENGAPVAKAGEPTVRTLCSKSFTLGEFRFAEGRE